MTAAISGHHPGAVVDAVSVANRDDGTNRRARLALRYATGDGPATVFVKAIDPEHADLVELTSGLYHEPRLFLSQVALPLDHPRVYRAVIDEERRDFLLLMEDVVARGPTHATRPGRSASTKRRAGCAGWPGCTAPSGESASPTTPR